jgi:hypothetical protein
LGCYEAISDEELGACRGVQYYRIAEAARFGQQLACRRVPHKNEKQRKLASAVRG